MSLRGKAEAISTLEMEIAAPRNGARNDRGEMSFVIQKNASPGGAREDLEKK